MTRRERKENRLARRLEWAEGRDKKAAAAFEGSRRIADGIPFGQPILIGHHSERHHRKDLERIDNGMRRGVESSKMAATHRSKAAGIADQLENSIFSDDVDAPERLRERIAELEAQRENMKKTNAEYKKGDQAFAAILGITIEQAAARRQRIEADYSWCRKPFPAYQLSNLGGNIGRLRKRLVDVEGRAQRAAAAEAAGGHTVEEFGEYVRVTFAEKPAREILDALRAAGFSWGAGSWCGKRADLPELGR